MERNWRLVKALLTNPYFGENVDKILVDDPLEALLVSHAEASGEGTELLASARAALRQPSADEAAHDDHFHLRIVKPPKGLRCSADPPGCR